jgi:hypothetical protein
MLQNPNLTRYSAPSSSRSSSSSISLDYAGLDDLVARRGALSGARDARFQALYGGNIEGGVSAGNRVRDLVGELRAYGVPADESGAPPIPLPLVRPGSVSSSSSVNNDGGRYEEAGADVEPLPQPGAAGGPAPIVRMPPPARIPGVLNAERKPRRLGEGDAQRAWV